MTAMMIDGMLTAIGVVVVLMAAVGAIGAMVGSLAHAGGTWEDGDEI